MTIRTLIMDGTKTMMIDFPNVDTKTAWIDLQMSIKGDAVELNNFITAGGRKYDGMSAEHKAFGESWLGKVDQLRDMGFGVPPSIQSSYEQYKAIQRGEEV